MVGDTILIKDISINGNNELTNATKLSETLTDNTINALGIDASSRTIWINGQPYGNAYVNIKGDNTVDAPIGAEIFNDFEHNIASGEYSHAEGRETSATGDYSHAEGRNTYATGDYSHASGFYTKTTNTAEAAFGQFNQSTKGSTIFSIGDGDSDSSRHNIVEVTDNEVNINTNLNVEDNLTVDRNTTIGGTLGVTGNTTVSTLESSGNVDLESLDVEHNTTIGGTLGVTGNTTVSTLESSGNVDLESLDVEHNTTIGGTLGVIGNTTVSTLESSGNVDLESLDVEHNTTIGGTLGVTGNTTVSTLESSGNVDLESLDVEHNTTIGGTLGVIGNTTVSTLESSGNVDLESLDVEHNTTIGGTLGVIGNTTVSTLESSGNVDLESLDVEHNTTIGGTLGVTNDITSKGNIVGENNLRIIGETSLENKVAAGKGALVTNDSEIAVGRFNKSTKNSENYGDDDNTAFSIGIGTSDSVRKNAVEVMQNGDVYVKGIGKYDGTNPSNSKDIATYLPNMVNITYTDLKTLRDSGQLVPGQQYRIINYTCTTTQQNTRALQYVFDIIVTADSKSTLNEEARAINHDFDNPGNDHFIHCNLSAWKIWYCLDNDTDRFAWANNSNNGRGVIYRMIDEFNNDVPYDFKNIQFKHPKDTANYPYYYYTFSSGNEEFNTDCSLNILNNCYSNTIKERIITQPNDDTGSMITKISLNCIIFIGPNCYSNTFGCNCSNNSFGSACSRNSFGNYFQSNTFYSNSSYNSFGPYCRWNSFGSSFNRNIFGSGCQDNSFGNECNNNTFGSSCSYNSFGNNCSYNTFGNDCDYIKFASDAVNTTKYNYYYYNHFGDGCKYILFKRKDNDTTPKIIQNYNFAQGLQGTSAIYLSIIGATNRPYDTYISKSSGTGDTNVYGYCLADIAKTLTNVETFTQ